MLERIQNIFDEFIDSPVLNRCGEKLNSIWGTLPKSPLHLGIDKQIFFQKKILSAGFNHYLIIDDYDLTKDKESNLKVEYYSNMFKLLGLENAKIIKTSQMRETNEYLQIFKTVCKIAKLKHVFKATQGLGEANPTIQFLLTPLLQTTDTIYLNIDLAFGGFSQRRIYMQTRDICKKMGVKIPACAFINQSTDIKGNLLKNSTSKTRISFHETKDSLSKKINSITCQKDALEKSVLKDLIIYSVFQFFPKISINKIECNSFEEINTNIARGYINIADVKQVITDKIYERLTNINSKLNKELTSWIKYEKFTA